MKNISLLFTFILLFLLINSCSYKFNAPDTGPVVDPNDTVSFSSQILPIFNNNNNCTSCHKAGGTSPDLTTANAFNELTSKGLINSSDASQSKIYTYGDPSNTTHSWKKYSTGETQLILIWITQGASNN